MPEAELTLGALIKRVRVSMGSSQRELGARLGVSAAYVSLLERDLREPSIRLLRQIATVSGVPLAFWLVATLWADLKEEDRAPFRPMVAALGRLAVQLPPDAR